MSNKLRQQLKDLHTLNTQINPDQVWVRENKAKLFAQINNTVHADTKERGFSFSHVDHFFSIFVPNSVTTMARPVFIFLFAISTTIGGWVAGASASQNSLPGDTLYGVKLATEKTQVTIASVTGDKVAETQLHLKFAGRRSEEVKQVIENKQSDAPQRAGEAITELKKSIESARKTVEDVGQTDVGKAVVLAKDVSKMTNEINKDLTEAALVGKADVSMTKEVVNTKEIVTSAGLDTVRMVVEKSAQTDTKTSDAIQKQVKELVIEKISTLSEDKRTGAEVLKTLSELPNTASSTPSITLPNTTVPQLSTSTVNSTNNNTSSTVSVKDTVKGIVDKVDKSVQLVDKMIGDARVLVEQKNLIDAIDKAKEVSKVSNETTRAVSDATEAVKKILTEPGAQPVAAPPVITPQNIATTSIRTTSTSSPAGTPTR